MKRISATIAVSLILTIILVQMPNAKAGPTYVSGLISSDTIWGLVNSPYIITDNVTVDDGVNLTIEPGVVVKLNFFTRLIINGSLFAEGEENRPITFTSNQSSPALGDWSSIKFDNAGNSSGIIWHTRIEYAIYGIWCVNSSPIIANNTIANIMSKGIYLQESDSIVTNNTVTNVSHTGIDIYMSSPAIESNFIGNTSYYGIKSYKSSLVISNNTVVGTTKGIQLKNSTSTIVGNRIASTAYGLYMERVPEANILDNQVEESGHGVYMVFSNSTVVRNNTITGTDFGLYTMSSSPFIVNSTILMSQHKDLHIAGESHPVTLNTTFDGSKVLISSDSTLTVGSFLAVKVEDKNGSALPDSNVEVEDNFVTLHESTTDSDGLSEWIIVTDRIYEGNDVATENVTTVGVSYETLPFPDNPRDVDMSASHTEVFRVNTKPTVNITSPSDGEVVNGSITVSGMSSDENGVVTWIEIRIDNGTWQTVTMLAPDWSVWSYQWDTTQHLNGEHIMTVRATDDCVENATFSIRVNVDNEETFPAEESDTDALHLWIYVPFFVIVFLFALLSYGKRKKRKEEKRVIEKPEEAKAEISLDERVERLEKALDDGLISRGIYELNLAKLKAKDTETSESLETEEVISYVCPVCNNDVEADATECAHCGAIFED